MTTKTYENEIRGFAIDAIALIDAIARTFKIDPNKMSTTIDPLGWINIELQHEGKRYEIISIEENSKEMCVYIHKHEFRKAVGEINKQLARALADEIRKELGITPEKQISVKELETWKDIRGNDWSERNLTNKSILDKLRGLFRR